MAQPKVDLSEFVKLSKPRKSTCPIGEALAALPPEEGAQLRAALALDKGTITNPAIVEWLKARGHKANVGFAVSHRRATCSCHA